jgi:hypothetical protein
MKGNTYSLSSQNRQTPLQENESHALDLLTNKTLIIWSNTQGASAAPLSQARLAMYEGGNQSPEKHDV